MVLFKRKPVPYIYQPAPIQDEQEIWPIEQTDEVFTSYDAYLQRMDFYRQKRFICEITGHSGLNFFDALQSEMDASDEVDDAFPDALKEPILRKVQFSTVSRLDSLVDHVFEEFKHDFYPGENITAVMDSGERVPGLIREKTKFPELVNFDGTIERKAFARYFLSIDNRKEQLLVDEDHIVRDRKAFTKQRLRSFLKKTVDRELWAGAPWCVKAKFADEYRIDGEIPQHLTYESQLAQRKVNLAMRKGEYGGQILDFFPRLPELKPKGQKAKGVNQDLARLSTEYQRSVAANPDFGKVPQVIQQAQIDQFMNGQNGFAQFNGYHPIAAKGHPKPPPPPPAPKYPIEDLELPPDREGSTRPAMKFLSKEVPSIHQIPQPVEDGISMDSVGYLLETWDTLNVYCEVFVLDSFTFDDYVEALQLTSDVFQCDLLVEIHCAVLKQLVNDINDRNGQIQISLPELIQSETEDESAEDRSTTQTVSPEPEVRPPGRTTRSSLAKAEAAELKGSEDQGRLPHPDSRLHRAGEMEQLNKDYDWKSRLRNRDFSDGRWVYIIVGLLNQLSGDPRRKKTCDEILAKLAPLDQEPSPQVTIVSYESIDINTRIKILQILCMLSLETKAIRAYMEDCNNNMTEYRKEKIDLQKKRRAAMEELRQLHEERKSLQPESKSASPIPELEELENSRMSKIDDEEAEADVDVAMDTEDDGPHRGQSLRRANNRAIQRKKRLEQEKERKQRAQAEKLKKPTKQEKQYEKILKKIEVVKEKIKEHEEEVLIIENDLREADCPRTKVLGKDRFWNRYYWFERNAMPYAGLPDSSTANAGYANGCLWVQGPDDLERHGFIELSCEENAQYQRAFRMTVPQRKMIQEGSTHVFNARQWAYYDDPNDLDALIGWLDVRGAREVKLRKDLQTQREKISTHMTKRKEYLTKSNEKKPDPGEPTTRVSTRMKTYIDPSTNRRCFAWRNLMAEREIGHAHAAPKPPSYRKKQNRAPKKPPEDDSRQTRATNRQGKPLARQGSRYNF